MVRIPTEDLIADLQRVGAKHGEPISQATYSEYGSYATTTIEDRFDSWNNGLKRAGIEICRVFKHKPVDVLKDLRKYTDENIAISQEEYNDRSSFGASTAVTHFDQWWRATVSAGLLPVEKRPLTPRQFDRIYREAKNMPPVDRLPALLFMFSGMYVRTAHKLSSEWVQDNRDRNIIKVPAKITGNEPWFVRLPETWVNPHTNERVPTKLPETVEWVLDHHDRVPLDSIYPIQRRCFELAEKAGIESRERGSYQKIGEFPLVRPSDLSYTHGANLVRQGVDSEVIERRLGADGYRGQFYVEDVMLWVYVHDGYEHPEFDPPPVVLDPDTGDPRYS